MDAEREFAALYKKLIDRHFAPESARAEAVLRGLLVLLSDRGRPGAHEKTVESSKRP